MGISLTNGRRENIILQTSCIGILVNLLLAGFKAVVGFSTNSIAILMDALNNLSDVLSSVITVAGAKLADRNPDFEHPFGHGRYEYLSALVISIIIFYAGVTAMVESVKKILDPEVPEYTTASLVLLAVAVIVKIVLGRYVKRKGAEADSGALIGSGSDALFDAVLSFSVLVAALIYLGCGVSLESYVGTVIACFILKSGFGMLRDTLNEILGERPDPLLVRQIKNLLVEEPEIRGAYDLMINNYGPGRNYASVHIELPDVMTVEQVDRLTHRIHEKVFKATGVHLSGVTVYSYNTRDPEAAQMREQVSQLVMKHPWALQVHGFYVDRTKKTMRFDVVVTFGRDREPLIQELQQEITRLYPDYQVSVDIDRDISALQG
ncbi:cation diffusion facilitator family transporter [uncultured Acidaminococcus sp.]|uniref:cation diffusion facilitator family transporter n=1 Tax=uncultured Acidaminococcus sp. TaxID=352152 RepID=UPI002622414F|nr:cation diffusion facilitator family transporter [uncultured Acidaminococcus sp.]